MSNINLSPAYDVKPANSNCSNIVNKNVVTITPGTPTAQTSASINNIQQQHIENTKYDNIGSFDVKPLHGGYKKKQNSNKIFVVKFMNNKYNLNTSSKKKALQFFLKSINQTTNINQNQNKKKDNKIIEIYEKNNSSNHLLYILI